MATASPPSAASAIEYPTTDFKPVGETELHVGIIFDARELVSFWYEDDPNVYVGCNLLVCYQEGDPRKFLCPDVFVARGVPKLPPRQNYGFSYSRYIALY